MTLAQKSSVAAATFVAVALMSNGSAQAFSFKKLFHGAAKAVSGAEKSLGHAVAGAGRDVGHVAAGAARDVGGLAKGAAKGGGRVVKAVYKEGDKINMSAGKVVGNVAAKALDTTGSVLDRIPAANFAGPVFHDAGKAVKSDAAHYGALVAVGGALVGAVPGTIGQAAVSGGMAGYYGRQVYLAGRCAPKETTSCKRLEAKP